MCGGGGSSTEWINGLSNPTSESYHPKVTGQADGYYPVVHGVTGGAGWELFVMGNVHGAVFTSYLVIITVCHRIVRWGPLMLLMVLLAGFIPGGGLMVERWALAAPAREAYQARQDG